MKLLTKAAALLCLLLALVSTASASTINAKFMSGQTTLSNTQVVAYLSFGRLEGITDATGMISFEVPSNGLMWFEVNGQRLAHVYREGEVPAVIDILAVGFITWGGGN